MVIEVDIVVLNPDRLGKFKRHLRQLTVKHRSEVQALAEHRLDILVVVTLIALGKLEKHKAADMHRRFWRFEMKKRGVNAAELIHCRSFPLSCRSGRGWDICECRSVRRPSSSSWQNLHQHLNRAFALLLVVQR